MRAYRRGRDGLMPLERHVRRAFQPEHLTGLVGSRRLERQLTQVTGRAERAEALVEAQKNLAALLGRPGASAQS